MSTKKICEQDTGIDIEAQVYIFTPFGPYCPGIVYGIVSRVWEGHSA